MHSVLHLYNVYSISIHCKTLYNSVHCILHCTSTMYNVLYTVVYGVQCTIQCTTVHYNVMYNVQYNAVHCTLYIVQLYCHLLLLESPFRVPRVLGFPGSLGSRSPESGSAGVLGVWECPSFKVKAASQNKASF